MANRKPFRVGMIGSYLYSWYIAPVWVPLYGLFDCQRANEA
jgi:hypothetical protein